MNESNKKSLIEFVKVFAIALLGFIVLIPNVEIWNMASFGHTDGFHVVVSILNLVGGFTGLYFFAKNVLFKKKTEVIKS